MLYYVIYYTHNVNTSAPHVGGTFVPVFVFECEYDGTDLIQDCFHDFKMIADEQDLRGHLELGQVSKKKLTLVEDACIKNLEKFPDIQAVVDLYLAECDAADDDVDFIFHMPEGFNLEDN
jgi:hypothetical protein